MITAAGVEPLSPLYDVKKECLFCKEIFTTKKVRSKFIRINKRDSDFCIHYEGVNPYFYEIFVCPHCNFAFTERFQPIKSYCKETIKKKYIDKVSISDLNGERNLEQAAKCFKLAILCATLAEESYYLLGGLCIKLAWLYRFGNNKEEEERFLRNALDNYLKTYEQEDLTRLNTASLLYIIGELEYRLGGYNKARKWFSILLSDRTLDPKIKKIGKNRWQDIRYEKEKGN